jgi:diguanylate cyclase (GGDEF)-like protein
MIPAPLSGDERERLAALESYDVLDTTCEASFDNIVHLAAEMLDMPISAITLIDHRRQWFKARVGLEATETPRECSFCAHAILEPRRVLIVPDAREDQRFVDNPLVTGRPKIRFYAGAPLVNPEGAALGALCVIDRQPRAITQSQQLALRRLADTAMTTLELRRAMKRVRSLAMIDSLTGIANRHALICEIERAIARLRRDGAPFGLVYVDLDGFKRVNDEQGHDAGDDVLRQVAVALKTALRASDLAGRLGGDEFAVLLAGDDIDAEAAAERMRAHIESRLTACGFGVTASVGAVEFVSCPESAYAALNFADRLMYRAKRSGKNQVACLTAA